MSRLTLFQCTPTGIAIDQVDDATSFVTLRAALTMVDVDDRQQSALWKTLSALLWLGDVTFAARQGIRPMGIATAGLQWGVLGDPTGVQLNIVANLGASFMTEDATEFLLAEAGVGAHYSLTETVQVNAEATYRARYRKGISHGGGVSLGVRYFFD